MAHDEYIDFALACPEHRRLFGAWLNTLTYDDDVDDDADASYDDDEYNECNLQRDFSNAAVTCDDLRYAEASVLVEAHQAQINECLIDLQTNLCQLGRSIIDAQHRIIKLEQLVARQDDNVIAADTLCATSNINRAAMILFCAGTAQNKGGKVCKQIYRTESRQTTMR